MYYIQCRRSFMIFLNIKFKVNHDFIYTHFFHRSQLIIIIIRTGNDFIDFEGRQSARNSTLNELSSSKYQIKTLKCKT